MINGWRWCLALAAWTAAGSVLAQPGIDTLYVHGHIYTADRQHPWVEAIAVHDEHIVSVGTDRALMARRPPKARVVDLHGKTVIPGLIDAHMHMLFGSMEIAGFSLSEPEHSITPDHPEALIATLRDFADKHPDQPILIGRGDFSSVPPAAPHHQLLDRAVSDRPLIVHNSTEHCLWLNAAALTLVGIGDDPVSDPEEERNIIRDASGRPTGVLLEAAQELVERAVMTALTTEQKLALLRGGMHYLNGFGITSVVNATGDLAEIQLYGRLRDRGELTVRTRTAFGAVAVPHHLTPQFLADLETARTQFHDEWVSANLVKFFADGSTGALPPLVYRAADYRQLVQELDRRGFQIMTHAERRDSVDMVLDAYQRAATANGPRDRRFRIEHDFVVGDDAIPQHAALSVIAGIQPAFCCSEGGTSYDPSDPTPSDRWHTLQAHGITIAMSSDWPCMWPPDPFVNMQQAVTRQVWRSPDTEGIEGAPLDGAKQGGARPVAGHVYNLPEAITIRQALDGYTLGAAYAAFAETRVGSLAPGKLADFAVLSQDLLSVPSESIGDTQVLMTVVGGKVVYGAPPPP